MGSETFTWTPFPPTPRGGEGPGPSLLGRPPPEPREVPHVQEQPAAGGAQTLRSCPMCQADFAPG